METPIAHADVALGAAETMLMEAFVLGRPAVSAIYWDLSKPVLELHKHISHSTDPEVIANNVVRYLDPAEAKRFSEKATSIVGNMDNPARQMINEIRILSRPAAAEERVRRRSRMEVLVDVVQATALGPCRPTQVMRQANISYSEFKEIVEILERKGLVKSETSFAGKFFQTTAEGLQLLSEFKGIRSRLFGQPR